MDTNPVNPALSPDPAAAAPAPSPVAAVPAAVVGVATFVKVPGGKFYDVEIAGKTRIGEEFKKLGIDVSKCKIQKNGDDVDLDEFVQPGDTVMAVTQIRGNEFEVCVTVNFR